MTKYKNTTTDCENMKMKIDEEAERKNDALRALSKAQAEIQLWKSKSETEALGRIDQLELEGNKSKLGARANESEKTIDSLDSKIVATEKTKHCIEVEDLQMEYERTHAAIINEKRGKN